MYIIKESCWLFIVLSIHLDHICLLSITAACEGALFFFFFFFFFLVFFSVEDRLAREKAGMAFVARGDNLLGSVCLVLCLSARKL